MKVQMLRKPGDVNELKPHTVFLDEADNVVVEEVVELKRDDFIKFSDRLLADYEFLAKRKDKMFQANDGVWHCILVKECGADQGVLIESEGYDYARYAAWCIESQDELQGLTPDDFPKLTPVEALIALDVFDAKIKLSDVLLAYHYQDLGFLKFLVEDYLRGQIESGTQPWLQAEKFTNEKIEKIALGVLRLIGSMLNSYYNDPMTNPSPYYV